MWSNGAAPSPHSRTTPTPPDGCSSHPPPTAPPPTPVNRSVPLLRLVAHRTRLGTALEPSATGASWPVGTGSDVAFVWRDFRQDGRPSDSVVNDPFAAKGVCGHRQRTHRIPVHQ